MNAHYHISIDGQLHASPRYEQKQLARYHAGLFALHGRRTGVVVCDGGDCCQGAMKLVETTESEEGEP